MKIVIVKRGQCCSNIEEITVKNKKSVVKSSHPFSLKQNGSDFTFDIGSDLAAKHN